ncbi:MAG: hypothetical protein LUD17_01510 [Bacteroidales bacterium]|nr:hypothetical protein [Bacteroidales bacterium]
MCTERYINPFTDFGFKTKFLSEAEVSNLSKEEYQAYEMSLKRMRDSQNIVNTAREEGRERGREEGRVEGIKEGIQKRNAEIVKGGQKMGLSIEQIAALTNLSIDQVQHLLEE